MQRKEKFDRFLENLKLSEASWTCIFYKVRVDLQCGPMLFIVTVTTSSPHQIYTDNCQNHNSNATQPNQTTNKSTKVVFDTIIGLHHHLPLTETLLSALEQHRATWGDLGQIKAILGNRGNLAIKL